VRGKQRRNPNSPYENYRSKSSSLPQNGSTPKGPVFLLEMTTIVSMSNDIMGAVSKRLDEEKLWGRCEGKGHCSDQCLKLLISLHLLRWTWIVILLISEMNFAVAVVLTVSPMP